MDGEATLALWRKGKDAWGAWARGVVETRRALSAAGKWSVDWYGEGENEETKTWLNEAAATFATAAFEADADFGGLHFPGPADFEGARFAGAANFAGAEFEGNVTCEAAAFAAAVFTGAKFRGFANFDKARFAAETSFEKAAFLKVSDLEPCARFQRAQFLKPATFARAQFAGSVQFVKTGFSGVRFDACTFEGDSIFKSAQFDADTSFVKARFSGARVDFRDAQFRGDVRFLEAHFGGSWAGLVISGACNATFAAARFDRDASFRQAWFIGESDFGNAQFNGIVSFGNALFVMPAHFAPAVFAANTSFNEAQFVRKADFTAARFLEDGDFSGAKFGGEALFRQVRFAGPAKFANAEFGGMASFYGISAEAAFTVDGARAAALLETGEANFVQAPAFEKMAIGQPAKRRPWWSRRKKAAQTLFARWAKAAPASAPFEYHTPEFVPAPEEEDVPAAETPLEAMRSLRTSAAAKIPPASAPEEPAQSQVQSQPQTAAVAGVETPPAAAEPEAASAEKQAAAAGAAGRFRVLRFAAWRAEEPPAPALPPPTDMVPAVAPRRRSVVRPLLLWGVMIAGFVPFYLRLRPPGHAGNDPAPFLPAWPSWLTWDGAPAWLAANAAAFWSDLGKLSAAAAGLFTSGPCVHGETQPLSDAVLLSLKNALVFLQEGSEQFQHRVYGCLYGLEGTAPVIPPAVPFASLAQAALSAAFLSMLLIALMGRLKRK